MLRPGEELFSMNNRYKAKVRADGSLIGSRASRLDPSGRRRAGRRASCNGWTYWHFRREGRMVPIDILRQRIRAEMRADEGRPN